jgi:hypothetical protein
MTDVDTILENFLLHSTYHIIRKYKKESYILFTWKSYGTYRALMNLKTKNVFCWIISHKPEDINIYMTDKMWEHRLKDAHYTWSDFWKVIGKSKELKKATTLNKILFEIKMCQL